MAGDRFIAALVKGDERYVFIYDDAGRMETLRTVARFAANPELSLTWFDAANIARKVRGTEACCIRRNEQ